MVVNQKVVKVVSIDNQKVMGCQNRHRQYDNLIELIVVSDDLGS